jgi:hypothetical protein
MCDHRCGKSDTQTGGIDDIGIDPAGAHSVVHHAHRSHLQNLGHGRPTLDQ